MERVACDSALRSDVETEFGYFMHRHRRKVVRERMKRNFKIRKFRFTGWHRVARGPVATRKAR
jgi:hypothetical protein